MSRVIQAEFGQTFRIYPYAAGVKVFTVIAGGEMTLRFTPDQTRELIAALQEALPSSDLEVIEHDDSSVADLVEQISKLEEQVAWLKGVVTGLNKAVHGGRTP